MIDALLDNPDVAVGPEIESLAEKVEIAWLNDSSPTNPPLSSTIDHQLPT